MQKCIYVFEQICELLPINILKQVYFSLATKLWNGCMGCNKKIYFKKTLDKVTKKTY